MAGTTTFLAVGAQAAAVVAGAFLSGNMMSISLITVPVIVQESQGSKFLLRQWATTYGLGIKMMPPAAIATLLLYATAIVSRYRASQPWLMYALAAAATVSIIPFTKIIMQSTNDRLFALDSQAQAGGKPAAAEAQRLVTIWRMLHTTRSIFPFIGAVLGFVGIVQEMSV